MTKYTDLDTTDASMEDPSLMAPQEPVYIAEPEIPVVGEAIQITAEAQLCFKSWSCTSKLLQKPDSKHWNHPSMQVLQNENHIIRENRPITCSNIYELNYTC